PCSLYDPAPTPLSPLSLHAALPISALFYLLALGAYLRVDSLRDAPPAWNRRTIAWYIAALLLYVAALLSKTVTCSLPAVILLLRSEEHTSELQSRENLVCRLLLEKQ